jgi:hypothetical protein
VGPFRSALEEKPTAQAPMAPRHPDRQHTANFAWPPRSPSAVRFTCPDATPAHRPQWGKSRRCRVERRKRRPLRAGAGEVGLTSAENDNG